MMRPVHFSQLLFGGRWQPTPVSFPGKSHGQRSLVDYSPQGCKESDTTEWLHFHFQTDIQPCPSTENWIKELLSMTPPIRTRPSFPYSQSLLSGSFHKPFILTLHRADRMKMTITENFSNWSCGPQPCLTQWNYEPCHAGPPKIGYSEDMVHWRRMANHFSMLASRTPWTVWKGLTIKEYIFLETKMIYCKAYVQLSKNTVNGI